AVLWGNKGSSGCNGRNLSGALRIQPDDRPESRSVGCGIDIIRRRGALSTERSRHLNRTGVPISRLRLDGSFENLSQPSGPDSIDSPTAPLACQHKQADYGGAINVITVVDSAICEFGPSVGFLLKSPTRAL